MYDACSKHQSPSTLKMMGGFCLWCRPNQAHHPLCGPPFPSPSVLACSQMKLLLSPAEQEICYARCSRNGGLQKRQREGAGLHRALSAAKATWAAPTAAGLPEFKGEGGPLGPESAPLPAWVAICTPAEWSRPTQGQPWRATELFPVLWYPDSTPLSFQEGSWLQHPVKCIKF